MRVDKHPVLGDREVGRLVTISVDGTEIEAVEGELRVRLRRIERAVRLRAGLLTDEDAARLDGLCRQLTING